LNPRIDFAYQYFKKDIAVSDVVWTYSGVRPLYDEGASSATAATRDYTLKVDTQGAPVLNIFGGKITTYRRLAESAMDKIGAHFPDLPPKWKAGVALPRGILQWTAWRNWLRVCAGAMDF
jgi:glycerol-3-phosphate dehydrogenase